MDHGKDLYYLIRYSAPDQPSLMQVDVANVMLGKELPLPFPAPFVMGFDMGLRDVVPIH